MDILTELHDLAGLQFNWFRRPPGLKRAKTWPADKADLLLALLARVSELKDKSVTDQVKDGCKAARERYGQDIPADRRHVDNGTSASDYGEDRDAFNDLLRKIATFGAVDVVVVWSVNRLSRTPAEGDAFMFFCWLNDVRVFVVKDSLADLDDGGDGTRAEYNLRRDSDWGYFDDEFKKGNQESRGKSRDIARGHRGNRENGIKAGEAPGGWVTKYDPVTREPGREVVLAAARVLVRMVRELAAGSSGSMVAWRLNQDDVPTFTRTKKDGTLCRKRATGRWYGRTVLVAALNPVHIGQIRKKPVKPGQPSDIWDLRPAADYFPIVRGPRKDAEWTAEERDELGWDGTEEEFIQLWKDARAKVKLLGQVKPGTNGYRDGKAAISAVRSGGSKHLQSFIAQCGVCGGPVRVAMYQRQNGHYYYLSCEKSGHSSVREDWADEVLTELVIDKLARLTREGGFSCDDAEALAANLRKQEEKTRFWDAKLAYLDGEAKDFDAWKRADQEKRQVLAGLQAEAEKLRIPVVIREFMPCKGDRDLIADMWEAKDPSARRATLKGLVKAIRHARSPLTKAQALRLPEEDRRQVARGQVSVEWADEFRQAGDICTVTETGVVAILEVPEGWRLCTGPCRKPQPADAEHFYADKSRADGWSNLCKPCYRARQRRYKATAADGGSVAVVGGAA